MITLLFRNHCLCSPLRCSELLHPVSEICLGRQLSYMHTRRMPLRSPIYTKQADMSSLTDGAGQVLRATGAAEAIQRSWHPCQTWKIVRARMKPSMTYMRCL